MGCQKSFAELQKMKNTQSKTKPIKTGIELGTTYCREKLNCVVCQSNKSRFLKQKHKNRK